MSLDVHRHAGNGAEAPASSRARQRARDPSRHLPRRGPVAALFVLAILMVAGIVHIGGVLLFPRVVRDDAYARIAAFATENVVRVLPGAGTAGDPLPDRDPSLVTAVCRYDLAQGPLRVSAAVGGGAFAALSLHSRSGIAFYGLDDRAANDGKLAFVLLTTGQRAAAETRDSTQGPPREVRVVAPEIRGFILFDVLPRIAGDVEAANSLASMRCDVEHPV